MFHAFRSCLGPLTCICIMFEGDVKMEPVEPLTSFTITKRLALISACSDKEGTCTVPWNLVRSLNQNPRQSLLVLYSDLQLAYSAEI